MCQQVTLPKLQGTRPMNELTLVELQRRLVVSMSQVVVCWWSNNFSPLLVLKFGKPRLGPTLYATSSGSAYKGEL